MSEVILPLHPPGRTPETMVSFLYTLYTPLYTPGAESLPQLTSVTCLLVCNMSTLYLVLFKIKNNQL